MTLELYNSLHAIHLQFGTLYADEVYFFTRADLCAALNVGNLALHKCIITTKPEIFHNFIQFDDKNSFYPIILNCALGQDRNTPLPDNLAKHLTSIVTHKTHYVDDNDESVNLSFGLGRDIAVNSIIVKPTLKNGNSL